MFELSSLSSKEASHSSLNRIDILVESFTHHTTVQPISTYKDDISLLPPTLPSEKTPASFAYRLDSKEMGKYEWMMVTFVPDNAGVSPGPKALSDLVGPGQDAPGFLSSGSAQISRR